MSLSLTVLVVAHIAAAASPSPRPHAAFDAYLPPGLAADEVADGFIAPETAFRMVTIAVGRVLSTRPLTIVHQYYIGAERRVVHATYACTFEGKASPCSRHGLRVGERVEQGRGLQPLVTTATRSPTMRMTLSNGADPEAFARAHAKLFVPQSERVLVLFDKDSYRMRVLQDGVVTEDFKVGYGQAKGDKMKRGDNKTPRGMYFVVQKSKGPFTGQYGAYYGGHWIKVNYPGALDAQRGLRDGLIDPSTAMRIERAWQKRALTSQNTVLGSGIGFHGWIDAWSDTDPHLSWGCMVLHNDDIARVFDTLALGTMVVLF